MPDRSFTNTKHQGIIQLSFVLDDRRSLNDSERQKHDSYEALRYACFHCYTVGGC